MAGFEAWRAGEAQSARPAASPTPERPHSCTCWGKHLNGNNVKFHSYLMSSDLTGPRGKDRSKIIVLDKFLREKKSNRQIFRDDVCGMKKEKARKSVAARPAQRQPEPARWLFVCLVIHLLCTGPPCGSFFIYYTQRSSSIPTVQELGRKSLLRGNKKVVTSILKYLINLKQLFLILKENETG